MIIAAPELFGSNRTILTFVAWGGKRRDSGDHTASSGLLKTVSYACSPPFGYPFTRGIIWRERRCWSTYGVVMQLSDKYFVMGDNWGGTHGVR